MKLKSPEDRSRINKRLRRIEGQVRGVQRMIDEGRDCRDIIQQLAAVRSAVQQAGLEVMRIYAHQCISDSESAMTPEEVVDYLVGVLGKWS
ncbi:MAG TPA: transcriptional regulator [Chloroflexi bacterium]|nr:transcriptional regulator [Chloroflexota bacterium]